MKLGMVQGAMVGVLQAERIPDAVRGRVLSLQNARLQVAAPAGIGLAGAVAEYVFARRGWTNPTANFRWTSGCSTATTSTRTRS